MKIKKSHVNINVGLLILILSLTVVGIMNQSFKPQHELETPKSSDGEITIITPENKTYTEPDNGYYPATYGFESEETGTNIDFIDLEESTGSCTLTLIPSFDNHKKVLDLYDTSSSYSAGGKNIFDEGQDYGTVEFWWALSDVTRSSYVWLEDSSANDILVIRYSGSSFGRFDSGGWQIISGAPSPSNNQWYHIRIDWELTAGAYMELSQNNFYLYIDGIQYGPYTVANTNTPDRIYLQTGVGASGGFHFYIDAVGYSWDPYYNIGDNLNEGLLLSYVNTTTLDWKGLSLDGQSNKTILGNTTIPMPSNGLHNIQVFGNDSINTMYESNKRWFTVNSTPYINIITPENKTYTQLDNGYYPATYGFENELEGSEGTEIGFIDSYVADANCYAKIITEEDGHKKCIEFSDSNSGGLVLFYNNFLTSQPSGSFEYWFKANDNMIATAFIDIYDGASRCINIQGHDGAINTNNGSWHTICAYSSNTWYHVKITFECGAGGYDGLVADKFNFYLNGNKYGSFNFLELGNSLTHMRAASSTQNSLTWHLDAVGYSWDQRYNVGDNLNEGLLLSYDSNINFDWQGYSLDSGANKTVLGNTTIPMPADGIHTIQVFGNDSIGTMYESAIRHFSVDTTPPEISITYPSVAQEFSAPPAYILSITEENIAVMWYTLNGGSNNPIASASGTIDSSAWNLLADGPVTIRFYIRDIADREAFDEVIVVKIAAEVPPIPPGIPGYNIIGLIGVTLAVTLILAKRKLKK